MEDEFIVNKKLIYWIPKESYEKDKLIHLLNEHREIKFVSFVGVDLWGNDTDEKILKNYLKMVFKQTDHQLI